MIIINDECSSCGMCIEECPFDAIEIDHIKTIEKGYAQCHINQNKCKGCKKCITKFECPSMAIMEK